ncbi:MAG: hypothetical protein ACFFD5_03395 [Candidatus Thorarchaeota archaeon]
MLNKYRKLIVLISIILISLVSIIEIVTYNNSVPREENFSNSYDLPKTQAISIEDYTPIIDDQNHGLGIITITNLIYNEAGFFNFTTNYPNLDDDLTSGALEMSYNGTEYIETKNVAQSDNLNDSVIESNMVTVLLNESIEIRYDMSIGGSEGYLIYKPSLVYDKLNRFLIQNESSSQIIELNEAEYSIDNYDFVKFNYNNYFGVTAHNFTMHLIWEVNIELNDWNILQDTNDDIVIYQQEQEIQPLFSYNFTVNAYEYNKSSAIGTLLAENMDIDLKITPPDRDQLSNHTLEVNGVIISNFLDANNTINVTINEIPGIFIMNFTTNYTLKFEDPIDYSWSIDRLIKNNNIRERIYLPTLISGPDHIYLSGIVVYESSITIDQVVSNYSLFNRDVLTFDANLSVVEEYSQSSLIFTENAIRKKGLKIVIPYLIKSETNPFFITYEANNDLLIIVTDRIRMPIINLDLEIYFYDKPYGSYISNDLTEPSAPVSTNFNGEVSFKNLATGNYTIRIYRRNNLIKETVISTFSKTYYIITDAIHFPLVIIIFGSISGIVFLIGLILYLNSRRKL